MGFFISRLGRLIYHLIAAFEKNTAYYLLYKGEAMKYLSYGYAL